MNYLPFRVYHVLFSAWRRRYLIAIPILIMPCVGFLVALSSSKIYKAHTSMLIQETAKMNPFLEDFAVSSMLKERMEALKTLLHSRHILNAVASELELIDDTSSDEEKDLVIARLSGGLSIHMAGKDLIRIDHRAGQPDGMKNLLTTVSKHFVEQVLAPERSSMTDSAFFLNEHLEHRRDELDKAEEALSAFRLEHAEALPEFHTMNIARLHQLKQKLSERQAKFAGVTKNVGGLNQLLSRTNPVVGRIEEKIVQTRSELAMLRARYTDRHSKVQGLLRTLRRLEVERQKALSNTEQIISSDQLWDMASAATGSLSDDRQPILISQLENLQIAKSTADSLQEEISRLQGMVEQIEKGISDFGLHENRLVRLQRDLKVKRELYEDLLQRYEMAQVTGSLGKFEQSKRVKVIDQPFTPSAPSNLPTFVFIIAGFFGGIFLGIGLAIASEMADTTIRYRKNLEEITGVPVLSRIPPIVAA